MVIIMMMTEKEKQIQIALGTYLLNEWTECRKLSKGAFLSSITDLLYKRFETAVKEVYKSDVRIIEWAIGLQHLPQLNKSPQLCRDNYSLISCTLSNGIKFE